MKQRTFSQDEVAQLYLGLWAVGDALLAGDAQQALALHIRTFQLIPDTQTNENARTVARHIRQKANKRQAQQEAA